VVFTEGTLSFGDSVIIVPVTNMSFADMAYPQLKLVPLTPLPPGMVQNTHWDTFASSWNAGMTMPANCFFDVAVPIPVDYSVTFELWANNLTPLLTGDSCRFDQQLIVNLNPSATGMAEPATGEGFSAWPALVSDQLLLTLPRDRSGGSIIIVDAAGKILLEKEVQEDEREQRIDVSGLAPGPYIAIFATADGTLAQQRIIIAR
jgi:hypothetical protein